MMGYERIFDANGTRSEVDFVSCTQCQATVDVRPGKPVTDAGAYCSTCGGIHCPRCAKLSARSGLCQPFEVALRVYEQNVETLRRWGYDPSLVEVPSKPIILPEPGYAR